MDMELSKPVYEILDAIRQKVANALQEDGFAGYVNANEESDGSIQVSAAENGRSFGVIIRRDSERFDHRDLHSSAAARMVWLHKRITETPHG